MFFGTRVPAAGECLSSACTDRTAGEAATTVLVVEDDRAVRLLFIRVLESAGYTVIACKDGAGALETARHEIAKIRALITDARMPGMSGQELVARLRKLRPSLPAIIVSGSAIERISDSATIFLAKPVSPALLTTELQRLLCGTM